MNEKRDYVMKQARAGQTRPHTCHWPGCTEQVPPAMWGCKAHWFTLPRAIRDLIWATYRMGQEEDGDPSPAYLAAADRADAWIVQYEQRPVQCPERESGGVQCEKEAGHAGPHACPEALKRSKGSR